MRVLPPCGDQSAAPLGTPSTSSTRHGLPPSWRPVIPNRCLPGRQETTGRDDRSSEASSRPPCLPSMDGALSHILRAPATGRHAPLAVVYCGCRKRDLQPSLIQVERSTRRCIALLWHRSTRRCSVQPSSIADLDRSRRSLQQSGSFVGATAFAVVRAPGSR